MQLASPPGRISLAPSPHLVSTHWGRRDPAEPKTLNPKPKTFAGAAKRLCIANADALGSVRIGTAFGVHLFLAGGAQPPLQPGAEPLLVPQLPLPAATLVEQYRVHARIDTGDAVPAQSTEMMHDPHGGGWVVEAGALLGRTLPVDQHGRAKPVTLWFTAELQGPDGPNARCGDKVR